MKLNDTSLYLSLIRDALTKSILPELQSADAKGAAQLIYVALDQLLSREDRLPDVIVKTNQAGAQILAEMDAALKKKNISLPTYIPAANPSRFDDIAADFAGLCAAMATRVALLDADDNALASRAAEWEVDAHLTFLAATPKTATTEAAPDSLPLSSLEAFLQEHHPAGKGLKVISLQRMPGGFGKQTYLTEIQDGSGATSSLVVRKNDKSPNIDHPSFDLSREFFLLTVVHKAGYPVPRPLWFGANVPGVDAPFMVVERRPGRMIGSVLDGAENIPESQMLELAVLLARLHAIDLDNFSGLVERFNEPTLLTDDLKQYIHRTMTGWRRYVEQSNLLPSPLITYLLRWLENNVPDDARRPVLTHGDFGIHNILAENSQVTAVLDWECAMFGAPELDLIYIQPTVSKHIAWDKFIAQYIAAGGQPPRVELMNYYMTFIALRVVIGANQGTRNLQRGDNRDIRVIMFELGIAQQFMKDAWDYAKLSR